MPGQTRNVFISHAHYDKKLYIEQLVNALRRHGVSYWIDTEQIPWGADLVLEISEGLRISQFVLLCLSKNCFDRRWVEHEMGAAISIRNRFGQNRVLPIILDDEDAVLEHYPLISDISYRRFRDGAEKIAAELRELVNIASAPKDVTAGREDYISAAEVCVAQLSRWFNQLSRVFSHLRSIVDRLNFEEFSEILTQLHLQIAAGNPIYLRDAVIRDIIENNCPDFDAYVRAKGALRALATSDTIAVRIRQQIAKFLDLCEEAEKTATRVKNPAWYDPGHPARQIVLADAISELNVLRLRLNENAAILSQT